MSLYSKRSLLIFIAALSLSACEASQSPAGSQIRATDDRDTSPSNAIVDGKIFAEVNGERRVWYVTHIERENDWRSGSFWRPVMGKHAQISIFGLTEKGARPTGKGDIQINFMINDPGGISKPDQSVLNLFADGFSKTWASDNGGKAEISLNRVVLDGDYIDLGGGFSGEVILPDLGNAATATNKPRTIEIKDGTFVAKLREFRRAEREE